MTYYKVIINYNVYSFPTLEEAQDFARFWNVSPPTK